MNNYKISGNIVDIFNNEIYKGIIEIKNGKIKNIVKCNDVDCDNFILPGLIDAHVHIESSLVAPSYFAAEAVKHGTVGIVADPHEIANVMGVKGINFMIKMVKTFHFTSFLLLLAVYLLHLLRALVLSSMLIKLKNY